jgi:hypothetical protein
MYKNMLLSPVLINLQYYTPPYKNTYKYSSFQLVPHPYREVLLYCGDRTVLAYLRGLLMWHFVVVLCTGV